MICATGIHTVYNSYSLPHAFCIVVEGRIVQVKKEPKAGLSLLVQVEKVHYDEIGLIKAKDTVEVTGYRLNQCDYRTPCLSV